MTDIYARNQAAYDRVVQEFARQHHAPLEGDLLAQAQTLVQHVGRGGQVLDIGCGTGRDMLFFESQGITVTGLDLSAGMLAFARRQVHGGLALMNMCRIGFQAASFDGAWSCASLLHVPKQDAPIALQEMRRVLRPGGMLLLTLQEGNSESWDAGYVEGVERFFARYQASEMSRMLTGNGFSIRSTDSFLQPSNKRAWLSFTCISK